MTIKELAEEREKLQKEYDELKDYSKAKGYKDASEKLKKIKDDFEKTNEPRTTVIQTRIHAIADEILRIRTEKSKEITLLPKVEEWLKFYRSGKENSYKYSVIWQSQSGKFVIVKEPGGMYFAGRGMQAYNPTKYLLIDVDKRERLGRSEIEHEGRLTKDGLEKMISRASELEKLKS